MTLSSLLLQTTSASAAASHLVATVAAAAQELRIFSEELFCLDFFTKLVIELIIDTNNTSMLKFGKKDANAIELFVPCQGSYYSFTSFFTAFRFAQIWQAWPFPNSPCFPQQLSIFLQLAFLGSLFIQFLKQKIKVQSKWRTTAITENGTHKHELLSLNSSFSYRASILCCSLLLAAHVVILLSLLWQGNGGGRCSSSQWLLWAEIAQAVSWVVALVAVVNFPKTRSVKIPLVIRIWWVCCFFQAAACAAIDIHAILIEHGLPNAIEYAHFLSILGCSCLLGISLRGKTGISFSSSSITDPLLYSTEKQAEGKQDSPYGRANLLQLITFSWLNPLFAVGIKKPLEQDQVPDVDVKDSAEFLSEAFDNDLKRAKERDGTQTPSIYKTIFLFIRKKAAINAAFAVVSASSSYVGPYLINDLVKFLSAKKSHSLQSGYLLALAFLSAKMVETTAQRQWIFGARQLGLRLRAALISHIYKKGLLLSSQSRQSRTSGEIINYMSVDIQRITDFVWYLNIIWMLPIQISLAIFILHSNLGLGSLAALAATAVVMAFNVPLTRTQKRFQSKIMEAKDERMKATSEVLRNIKTLKLQAWDTKYLSKLEGLRKIEYNWLWKSLRLSAMSAFIFWGSPAFISGVTFGACILMGIPLTSGRVLSALATFRMLQDPIFSLPDLLSVLAQAKVSVDRVAAYLQEGEIQTDAVEFIPRSETELDVEIDGGEFSWDGDSGSPTLSGIQLKVKRGMKVAICGTVGSGKSGLISCILGEMPKLSGTVKISGTKAYVPQSPWILTGNIRSNIIFGNAFDSVKYDKTVQACALVKDFELFSCGDLTEIGERGINMSGGQKQRIQIARAVYQDADIYLLDDPFSAVDAHTGRQLFEECLLGLLKDKTVLYVTHQVEFLPAADLILNGRIAQAGKFEELLQQNIGFEVLVGAHSEALESIVNAETSSRTHQKNEIKTTDSSNDNESDGEETVDTRVENCRRHESDTEITDKSGRIVGDEEREKGSIGKEVYWTYLTAVKGGASVPFIILAQAMFQIMQVASNYWMAWASPPTTETAPPIGMSVVFMVYILLAIGSALCVLVRAMLLAVTGLLAAEKFFMNMLRSILRAPMSFFDSTPTGRILNREKELTVDCQPSRSQASTDQSVLDLEIAGKVGWCAFSIIQILGTIAVMSQVAWQVFAVFFPVVGICFWYQQYYIPTARELARLSGIQRAPILHHFAESLSGAATIRAFGHKERFIYSNLGRIDSHSRPWFHNVSAMEWLSFRLNMLSNFVFAFSLVLLVSLPDGVINPSIAGLAVTYGLNLNAQQATIIWNICNTENKMISVERILQYSKLKSEAPLVIEDCRPPNNWPTVGTISFRNLQVRYAEHLPVVLRNITCTFPGKMKVGVVGRTGSGKSTLIQAIFRIVEPTEGSIVIDDVDICKIGLHDLRSRLSIIPQDPTMFEGTVRGNLDPLGQHTDTEIWEALDKCQLGNLVREKEAKLDSPVVENGENWSVGQRQLFCLGRALLKKSSILVLDEATASIDSATDGIIQQIIRQEFSNRTVVTIAHRIHTVIDSDLVLVLGDGRTVEYGTPMKLLENVDSSFAKLIREYASRSQNFNSLANSKKEYGTIYLSSAARPEEARTSALGEVYLVE
ncbi:ATP-binding cassette sub- C member 9 [Asimina triloba]